MAGKHLMTLAAAALAAACAEVPPASPSEPAPPALEPELVPPAYPERRLAAPTPEAIQAYVEQVAADRFGAAAVEEARAARTSIIAAAVPGRFNSPGPRVNMVVRAGAGWIGWGSGRRAPLPSAVGLELERLLASPAFRAEPDRYPATDCPDSGASLMVIRYEGRVRLTRQSCMPANLIGRLSQTVIEERVQPAL